MTSKTLLAAVAGAVAAASIAATAFGQTNTVRDFGAGFERFRQLGLPDVAGGTYGNLQVTLNGMRAYAAEYSRLENMGNQGMKGNAWKIRDLGGGTGVYVKASGQTITAMDQKTYEEWMRKRQEAAAKEGPAALAALQFGMTPDCAAASWSATDAKKDAERWVKYMEKMDDAGEASMFQHDENMAGEMLLFAALLHRSGCVAEANRIADRLFKLQTDPKRPVAAAMNRLASVQYGQACDQLAKSGDWSRFHADVSLVTNRFQGGWNELPGARRLLDLVRARIGQAELPPVSGEGLTAEDQQLARELATARPAGQGSPYGYGMYNLWILPAQRMYPVQFGAATNDVMARIVKRGMASVPLLVALIKDDTLTLRDRQSLGFGQHHYYGDMRNIPAEQVFRNMGRPATRGEVAQALLRPLLPVSDQQMGEVQQMDGSSLGDEIVAWYKENGKKSPYELAKVYLEKGNGSQQSFAINTLLRVKDLDQKSAEIESLLLAAARNAEYPPTSIQQYVSMRREKAADFVEKVAAIYSVTNAPATPQETATPPGRRPRRGTSQEQMAQQRRQFVEGLRTQVKVLPFRQLVAEIAAGTGATQRATAALYQAIAREKPAEALTVLLDAANKTDDPEVRCTLVGFCANVRYAGMQNAAMGMDTEDGEVAPEPPKPAELDPALHAPLWKPLLDDKRGSSRTVRETVAWIIEALYAKQDASGVPMPMMRQGGGALNEAIANLGEQGADLIVERARARLAGTALPEIPNASKVDDAARKKLVADLLAAADPVAVLGKLSADEKLAAIVCGRTNAALNVKLRPVANRIVKVTVAPEYSADTLAAQLKDRPLDRETAGKLLQICRALSKAGYRFSCSVTRKGNLGGTEITLGKPPKQPGGTEDVDPSMMFGVGGAGTNRTDKTAHVDGWLMGGKFFARSSWPAVETPAPVVTAEEGATAVDRLLDEAEQDLRGWVSQQTRAQQDGFWIALDDALQKTPAFIPLSIGFEGYPAEGAKAPAKP